MAEVPVQSQPTKRGINWKTILISAVIGGLVVGIGALGFYLLQGQSEDTTSTQITTTKTPIDSAKQATSSAEQATISAIKNGWKTYTSTRDGYSISIPGDWIVIPETFSDGPYVRNFDPSTKTPEDPPKINYPKDYINLRVLRSRDSSGIYYPTTAIDWYNKLGTSEQIDTPASIGLDISTLENYYLNELSAKRVKNTEAEINEFILIPHNNFVYSIIIYPYGGSTDKTVDQMLSTFKFLD